LRKEATVGFLFYVSTFLVHHEKDISEGSARSEREVIFRNTINLLGGMYEYD